MNNDIWNITANVQIATALVLITIFLAVIVFRNTSKSLKFGLFYSILVELIQLWAPTRVFDFYDLTANILGLLSGLFTFSKVRKH